MKLETYQFKTKPYNHQYKTLEQSYDKDNYALFLEMGLGKSKILIDNIGILFQAKKISGVVIVAPKGVLDNWSINEIERHLPDDIARESHATLDQGLPQNGRRRQHWNLKYFFS